MRKDNELLMGLRALSEEEIEARMRDQAYQMRNIAYKEEKSLRTHQKPLQGEFKDYLTEIDCTSPCERLPDAYQRHLDGAKSSYDKEIGDIGSVWFQSAVSGMWYQNRAAAGDVCAIKIDGKHHYLKEGTFLPEWWEQQDKDKAWIEKTERELF